MADDCSARFSKWTVALDHMRACESYQRLVRDCGAPKKPKVAASREKAQRVEAKPGLDFTQDPVHGVLKVKAPRDELEIAVVFRQCWEEFPEKSDYRGFWKHALEHFKELYGVSFQCFGYGKLPRFLKKHGIAQEVFQHRCPHRKWETQDESPEFEEEELRPEASLETEDPKSFPPCPPRSSEAPPPQLAPAIEQSEASGPPGPMLPRKAPGHGSHPYARPKPSVAPSKHLPAEQCSGAPGAN
ncbi:unnamed protein product [Symbiodinium natans]|uniref:Uncharacterized protein n=1 Tax=Symbiodinium natans TaxID=878477 RepID=A0A812K5M5_9DINO|nr:unnamed protein product [Symbiodinium natans]